MNTETREERIKRWAEFHSVDKPRKTNQAGKPQCAARVMSQGGWHSHQCTRHGRHEEEGHTWCKQHLPSRNVDFDIARSERWRREWEEKDAVRELNRRIGLAEERIADHAIAMFEQRALGEEAYDQLMQLAERCARLRDQKS